MKQTFPIRNKGFQKFSRKFEIKSAFTCPLLGRKRMGRRKKRRDIYRIQRPETALFFWPPSTGIIVSPTL